MLLVSEDADRDKLFLDLSVSGHQQSRGFRRELSQLPDTDRIGLAQWAPEGSSLHTDQAHTAVSKETSKGSKSSGEGDWVFEKVK